MNQSNRSHWALVFAIALALNDESRARAQVAGESLATSLVAIIAVPEKFSGKTVYISGYLLMDFENTAIYISREHALHTDTSSAVWVDGNEKVMAALRRIAGRWVEIRGVFNGQSRGHMGIFAGAIDVMECHVCSIKQDSDRDK